MNAPNGFNPMRYDCENQGCFNKKRRPKIEVFADCFPGKINFGDVDAEVEINGYSLRIEWKCNGNTIPKGQKIMYERKTRYGIDCVLCVHGNAETMEVFSVGSFVNGEWQDWEIANLDELKTKVSKWSAWAQKQPPISTIAGIMRSVLRKFKASDILSFIAMFVNKKEKELHDLKEIMKIKKESAA